MDITLMHQRHWYLLFCY